MNLPPILRALALAVLLKSVPLGAAELASGPMSGLSGRDRVDVWLMTDADAHVVLEYWPLSAPAQVRAAHGVAANEASGHAVVVRLEGLAPATRYGYRVRLDGKDALPETALEFVTQAAPGAAPRDFSLATGSCAYLADAAERAQETGAGAFRIFEAVAERRPDLVLWLGDTVYYRNEDFAEDAPARMNARWAATRTHASLQRLLRSGHHYGIWDDHDYGPDNSDRGFALKTISLALFRRYWANGSYGLPGTPGVFSKVSYEDVDIFLLDDRYHRDGDAEPDARGKTMLGRKQLDWLKRELLRSRASFKLIANGSRMLSDRPSPERRGGEGWHNHPGERRGFLDWLAARRIDGVVFLSGDIHYTHITERTRRRGYPLVELTCSPFTSRVHPRPNPVRPVAETVTLERNFCMLDFSGPAGARELVISAWGSDGAQLWQRRYAAASLRFPK